MENTEDQPRHSNILENVRTKLGSSWLIIGVAIAATLITIFSTLFFSIVGRSNKEAGPIVTEPTPGQLSPNPTTSANNTFYTCPSSTYIDCMPMAGSSKKECRPEYLSWAQANCPGFKGATY